MFEGNNQCALCERMLEEKQRQFKVSFSGFTYAFCNGCLESRKSDIERILDSR